MPKAKIVKKLKPSRVACNDGTFADEFNPWKISAGSVLSRNGYSVKIETHVVKREQKVNGEDAESYEELITYTAHPDPEMVGGSYMRYNSERTKTKVLKETFVTPWPLAGFEEYV